MAEPQELKRGKAFQKQVQADFHKNSKDGTTRTEARISFADLPKIAQNWGRADILVDDLGDYVALYEIKATDWDRIVPKNVTKNLWRHQNQLLHYVDKFLEVDQLDVCLGIIYPLPPKKPGLRDRIESYLEAHGTPAYWYSEIRTETS
jgi:hypothetical protein